MTLLSPNSEAVGTKNMSGPGDEPQSLALWALSPTRRGNKKIRLTLPSPFGRGMGALRKLPGGGIEANARIYLHSTSYFRLNGSITAETLRRYDRKLSAFPRLCGDF